MPNWNAYKVFANGKRAKSPYTTFESDESNHFFESILPTLEPKLQKCKWVILNTESPQERPAEQRDEVREKFEKDRIRFLSKLAGKNFPNYAKKNTEACLMMCSETDWKWAWCIAEGATLKFLGKLSDKFNTPKEANSWIQAMVGSQPTE